MLTNGIHIGRTYLFAAEQYQIIKSPPARGTGAPSGARPGARGAAAARRVRAPAVPQRPSTLAPSAGIWFCKKQPKQCRGQDFHKPSYTFATYIDTNNWEKNPQFLGCSISGKILKVALFGVAKVIASLRVEWARPRVLAPANRARPRPGVCALQLCLSVRPL